MLRAQRQRLRKQLDGDEVDIDACVEARADLMAGLPAAQAVYQSTRLTRRDLAITQMYFAQMLSRTADADATIREMRVSLTIFESLASGENATAQSQIDLAQCYETMGDIMWNLSEGEGIPLGLRRPRLQEARAWYQRGLEAFRELQRQGKLEAGYAGKSDQLAKAIEDCDRALAN